MTEPKRYDFVADETDDRAVDGVPTIVESPDGKYVLYTDFQESERKREAAENMIRELLASAVPHPKEHPTMCAAWKKANEVLASLKE